MRLRGSRRSSRSPVGCCRDGERPRCPAFIRTTRSRSLRAAGQPAEPTTAAKQFDTDHDCSTSTSSAAAAHIALPAWPTATATSTRALRHQRTRSNPSFCNHDLHLRYTTESRVQLGLRVRADIGSRCQYRIQRRAPRRAHPDAPAIFALVPAHRRRRRRAGDLPDGQLLGADRVVHGPSVSLVAPRPLAEPYETVNASARTRCDAEIIAVKRAAHDLHRGPHNSAAPPSQPRRHLRLVVSRPAVELVSPASS